MRQRVNLKIFVLIFTYWFYILLCLCRTPTRSSYEYAIKGYSYEATCEFKDFVAHLYLLVLYTFMFM
jgi:hypothetical protein